jgi:putative ubiquitin-RnfH superfamily antitoxin RatB of RatAB toxin-antitoxin module
MSVQEVPDAPELHVSVVYALPEQQHLIEVTLPARATVQDAVNKSALLRKFPEIGGRGLACAIFSRPVALTTALHEGDRVEILRPLLIDPKENRRRSATRARRKSA